MVKETETEQQAEFKNFKEESTEYHRLVVKRQQLDGQLNENNTVKEELELLKDGNQVYKLVGPVLVKQDLVDAKYNVGTRIEWISGELKRTEKAIEEIEKKQEARRLEMEEIRKAHELRMASQAAGVRQ